MTNYSLDKGFKRRAAYGLFGGLLIALASVPANPQQLVLQRIEALVNDEVISALDLNQRLSFIIAATGGVANQEELERMEEQILRNMVDERLQLQEGAQFEVEVPDNQLEDAFGRISQGYSQAPDQFEQTLVQMGSSKNTLISQLRAEFTWQILVDGRWGSQVEISDEDVEEFIARMKRNTGKYEYRVSEIYLIVDQPRFDQTVRGTAQGLVDQVRGGANFAEMARQFSAAATAARGGELGWVSEGTMIPTVEESVASMDLNEVSDPISTPGGYYVLLVTDRRRILSADPLDTELHLKQVYLAFDESTTQEGVEDWLVRANENLPDYQSCESAEPFASFMSAQVADAGFIAIRDFAPEMRQILIDLSVGQSSTAVGSDDGIRVFFVCGKREPEIKPPDFDEVFNQLTEQRLAMIARRYLRDLRRDAIIDYR